MTGKEFMSEYAKTKPFVVRDSANNDLFRALARKQVTFDDVPRTLGSKCTHILNHHIVTKVESVVRVWSHHRDTEQRQQLQLREGGCHQNNELKQTLNLFAGEDDI